MAKKATIIAKNVNKSNVNKSKTVNKTAIIDNLINPKPAKPAKTKKAKVKKAKVSIHETAYGKQVLAVNKELKVFEVSLNGAIRRLLTAKTEGKLKLTSAQLNILTKSKSKAPLYKRIGELVTPSKSGNYSPFKVLQKIYKFEEELVKLTK